MKELRLYFLMGGIALGLALPHSASAEDQLGKIDESKPRNERGMQWVDINPNVQAPVTVTPLKKVEINKAALSKAPVKKTLLKKNTTAAKPATKSPVKAPVSEPVPIKTAVQSPSQKQAEVSNTELVSFQQQDGPVITATLDKPGNQPKYKVGDKLVLNVKAHQDCNVVVFNFDSTGTLTQIFPNDYQQNSSLKAGASVEIGGEDSNFDYQISGKGGAEKIFIYAYPADSNKLPLPTLTAMAQIPGTPFRGMDMTIDKYRELVNGSKVFFGAERAVKVMPKSGKVSTAAELVAHHQSKQQASSPNKIELSFMVEK